MTLYTHVWVIRTRRDSGYSMCEISAVGSVERVKKLCDACDNGGRPRGGAKDELVVLRRGGKVDKGAIVSTQYTELLVGDRFSRLERSVMDTCA